MDVLFAHRTLAEKCPREKVPFHPLTDFRDMLLALQEYQSNGHQSEEGIP